jgi:Mce-associated membrane protein
MTAASPPRPVAAPRPRLLLLAVVTAVALSAAALLGTFVTRALGGTNDGTASSAGTAITPSSPVGAQLLGAARQAAVTYTSYDYRHLPSDIHDFATLATSQLAKAYTAEAKALIPQFKAIKVRSSSSVVVAGIGQVTAATAKAPLTATVLVALDDTVHNTRVRSSGQPRYDRMVLQMQRVDGRWLCAGINADG